MTKVVGKLLTLRVKQVDRAPLTLPDTRASIALAMARGVLANINLQV